MTITYKYLIETDTIKRPQLKVSQRHPSSSDHISETPTRYYLQHQRNTKQMRRSLIIHSIQTEKRVEKELVPHTQRTYLTGLEPSAYAMEVKSMVTNSCTRYHPEQVTISVILLLPSQNVTSRQAYTTRDITYALLPNMDF